MSYKQIIFFLLLLITIFHQLNYRVIADDTQPVEMAGNETTTDAPEGRKHDLLNQIQGVVDSSSNETVKIPENITSDVELKLPDLKASIELNLKVNSLPIDLPTALKIAINNNYTLKTIVAIKDQSKWAYYRVKSTWLPDVTYLFQISKLSGDFVVGGVVADDFVNDQPINSQFTINWNAFTGLERYFLVKAARNNFESKKNKLAFTKEEIILSTVTQYYELLRAKLKIEIQMRNLQQTNAQVKITQQQYDAGIGTKFDLLRAQSENAKAKQSLLYAYNSLRLKQAALANTMGIDVYAPLFPEEKTVDEINLLDEKYKLSELTALSLENRYDIKAAKNDVLESKAFKNAAYSNYLPYVNVFYQQADAGNIGDVVGRNYGINAYATWDPGVGMGLTAYTEIRRRKEIITQRELELANLTRNVQESLLSSFYSTYTAEAIVQAAREEVKAAKESLRLAFVRLQAGIGIFVDVLQAQTTATNAKNTLLDAVIVYNISQAKLLFDMGVIDEKNVISGYKPKSP